MEVVLLSWVRLAGGDEERKCNGADIDVMAIIHQNVSGLVRLRLRAHFLCTEENISLQVAIDFSLSLRRDDWIYESRSFYVWDCMSSEEKEGLVVFNHLEQIRVRGNIVRVMGTEGGVWVG